MLIPAVSFSYNVTPFLKMANSCLSSFSDFAWILPDATSSIYWKNRSAAASFVSPSAIVPALKSIQLLLYCARWLLLETLMVGTGLANGVPRPVVNSTICAPAAAKALEATKSLPGACSKFNPFFVTRSPYSKTSSTIAVPPFCTHPKDLCNAAGFITRRRIFVDFFTVAHEVFFKIVN